MKRWIKYGLIGIAVFLLWFLCAGLLNAYANDGKCIITCSAGSGQCDSKFSECFMATWIYDFIPASLFTITAKTQIVSQAFLNNYLMNRTSEFILDLLVFFIIGAITGLIAGKIKSKKIKKGVK